LKNILGRIGFGFVGWAVIATLVITVIGLGYWAVEKERQLSTIKTEKDGASEEGAQAKSLAAKLGQVAEILEAKLDNAEREIQRLSDAAAGAEAKAREYENEIASLRQGRASCEEFFDGWGVEASPSSIVKLFGIAREATAATDCINKGDAATACKHWEGLLVQIKKIGSPVSESQTEIEKLIRQHNCKKF
jgi:TolA-binding protein